jgi:hypothetical protein
MDTGWQFLYQMQESGQRGIRPEVLFIFAMNMSVAGRLEPIHRNGSPSWKFILSEQVQRYGMIFFRDLVSSMSCFSA